MRFVGPGLQCAWRSSRGNYERFHELPYSHVAGHELEVHELVGFGPGASTLHLPKKFCGDRTLSILCRGHELVRSDPSYISNSILQSKQL